MRQWVHPAEADQGDRPDLLTTTEKNELAQLRRENAELRRANEILKAALVFFAKELDQPCTRPTGQVERAVGHVHDRKITRPGLPFDLPVPGSVDI
ncbi:hypothetical protein [Streptomyces noursei]|uniref:hypothetical protein n=1 Tax=Streptomyces noursei TaxID=1971 RepID=UPI002154FAE1|nr:hypothetical protein [Streptomyces noursei]